MTWTTPYMDPGLTAMYRYATDASTKAEAAATATSPITAYGLIGQNDPNYTPKDSNGFPKWNNESYGLILGNKTILPMLIGSNGGITICDTNFKTGATGNGSSVVLSSSGIGLHGTTINLTTNGGNITNSISLSGTGINLGTNGIISMAGGAINLDIDSNNYFHLDTTGVHMKGKHIYINDQQEWSRDDIVVMNPNASNDDNERWKRDVKYIENYMKNGRTLAGGTTYCCRPPLRSNDSNGNPRGTPITHDWVLIRPYYDLSLTWSNNTSNLTRANSETNALILSPEHNSGTSIGDNADWYKYKITFEAMWGNTPSGSGGFASDTITMHIKNTNSSPRAVTIDCQCVNLSKTSVTTYTFETDKLSGNSKNLSQDDVNFKIWYTDATYDIYIQNISVVCTAAGTGNSKLPCTVYYYPYNG